MIYVLFQKREPWPHWPERRRRKLKMQNVYLACALALIACFFFASAFLLLLGMTSLERPLMAEKPLSILSIK